MHQARVGFDAVLIGGNEVLAVGDDNACLPGGAEPGSERAEVYYGVNDSWDETGSLNKPRKSFATVVLDSGLAMVIGGVNPDDVPYSSTKKFFPESDGWADGPLLNVARPDPRAVRMADGRVLVASWTASGETQRTWTTEILDEFGQRWSRAAPTHDLTGDLIALTDGRVIHATASFESKPSIVALDPGTMRWSPFPAPTLDAITELVPLNGGDILAFGMDDSGLGLYPSSTVMRYVTSEDRWIEAASIPTVRTDAQIAVMADGRVLVAGGHQQVSDIGEGEVLSVTEIYDPTIDAWASGPDLLEPRRDGHALTLEDGSVLLLGGNQTLNVHGDTPFCPPPMTSVERLYPTP